MRTSRIAAIVLRQYYLLRGSASRIVPLFIWAAVDMVLWGFMSRYLGHIISGFNFVSTLLGAVLLWDFCTRVMQGVTLAFFEDVWSRNFLNIFATPLSITEYLLGLVLSSIGSSSIGLVVMLVLAIAAFGLSFLSYGLMLIPFFLVLFLFGIALGIAAVAMVLRLGPASEWFVWPVPALLSPFAGVFYPLSTLPAWMRCFSYLLPPAYVFQEMRALLSRHPASLPALALALGLSLGYILLACWFFQRMYRHAVRTGLIARYSARLAVSGRIPSRCSRPQRRVMDQASKSGRQK
jgi:ABC-2 type transport system permease protein